MMEKIRFTVSLERPFYQPGQTILGHVICDFHQPIQIDSVEGRIHSEVHFFHQPSFVHKTRTIIDERSELWRYQTVSEMLGMHDEVFYDENQNPQHFSSESPSGSSTFTSTATFPIRCQLPHFAPPSFHCPGSPVTVRFALEIQLFNQGVKVACHEENLIVLNYESAEQNVTPKPINFDKTFHFSKERSISLDMLLPSTVFSTTAKIENCITVTNRWKQSLKYVHLNVVRRISALNQNDEVVDTVKIDTTGVGLPSGKQKIAVGETYSFRPRFNIPALPPNIHVKGLFKTEYSLKVSIGRANNFVLASYEVPITIITTEQDAKMSYRRGEEVLVDISSSHHNNNNNNNNILSQLPVDLLA
uniref:Arrestin_N domain-containing protein n=2 Tax=Caenorhabditis japonica TaxID=281687 RepID=A0A8R1HU64_CAEJA